MKTAIDITAVLGPDLKSRSVVGDLALYVVNTGAESVVVDFSQVQFVTRSFVDEFYNTFVKQTPSGVQVELTGVSEDIQAVFEAVKSTQTKKKPTTNTGTVRSFDTISQLRDFLSGLAL